MDVVISTTRKWKKDQAKEEKCEENAKKILAQEQLKIQRGGAGRNRQWLYQENRKDTLLEALKGSKGVEEKAKRQRKEDQPAKIDLLGLRVWGS